MMKTLLLGSIWAAAVLTAALGLGGLTNPGNDFPGMAYGLVAAGASAFCGSLALSWTTSHAPSPGCR